MELMFHVPDPQGTETFTAAVADSLGTLGLGPVTVDCPDIGRGANDPVLLFSIAVAGGALQLLDLLLSHGPRMADLVRRVADRVRDFADAHNGRIDSSGALVLAMEMLLREHGDDIVPTWCVNLSVDLESGVASVPPAALRDVPRALYVQVFHVTCPDSRFYVWAFGITSRGEVKVAERFETHPWAT